MSAGPAEAGSVRDSEKAVGLCRAWVAARLSGVRTVDIPRWTSEHGLPSASGSTFERAVASFRAIPPSQFKRGRGGGGKLQRRAEVVREWLLIDEPALGIRKTMYRLPNDGFPQPDLLRALGRLPGVRQVLEAGSDRELVIVALTRTEAEAFDLRSQLEELAPGRSVRMDPVSEEMWSAASDTWIRVAARSGSDG